MWSVMGWREHGDNVLSGVFILAVSHNRRYIDKLVICDGDKGRKPKARGKEGSE